MFTNVLTDTARLGIFRYFPGFAPVGYNVNSTIPNQQLPVNAGTASWVAVDVAGNPVAPPGNPNGSTPYTAGLTCFSVFGNMRLDTNGNMVPFIPADCPNGTAVFPQSSPAANGRWDTFRPVADSTGAIRKLLAQMPRPNYFGALDGLNLAQYAYLQKRGGSQGGQVATDHRSQRQQQADQFQNRSKLQREPQGSVQLHLSAGRQRGQHFLLAGRTGGTDFPAASCFYCQLYLDADTKHR